METRFSIVPFTSLGETLDTLVINGSIQLGQPEFQVQFSVVKSTTSVPVNMPAGSVNLSGTITVKRSDLEELSEKHIAAKVAIEKGLQLI